MLANLFMHYAFDTWLEREFPTVEFERYADDAVVHCATERQAREVLAALEGRMVEVGLRLHPDKTKIVYCKDQRRRGSHEHTSFTFLGYTFGPRTGEGKDGKPFLSFHARGQPGRRSAKMGQEVRRWRVHMRTGLSLDELADDDQPDRGGLDELLRPVLPVAAVSPPAAHQHLPDALGRQESTNDCAPTDGSSVVARAPRSRPRAVHSTGGGCARSPDSGEKSGVTGDCHAPFCGSPGVQFPRATRLLMRSG